MQEYVAGFLFDPTGEMVALVEKQRPEWQKGCWNAIGGKVEQDERHIEAMRREFYEETGVWIEDWKGYITLEDEHGKWMVEFYYAFSPKIHDVITKESERIMVFPTHDLPNKQITNLKWLLEMALSMKNERAAHFVVTEQYAA